MNKTAIYIRSSKKRTLPRSFFCQANVLRSYADSHNIRVNTHSAEEWMAIRKEHFNTK